MTTLSDWLKKSLRFLIKSEVTPKPIATHSYNFSRALCRLHSLGSSFDWFTRFSVFLWLAEVITLVLSFLIFNWKRSLIRCDYVDFGFTAASKFAVFIERTLLWCYSEQKRWTTFYSLTQGLILNFESQERKSPLWIMVLVFFQNELEGNHNNRSL